jgi:tRNA threonylcarbamoyladenosine biosynthesis protein TsaE
MEILLPSPDALPEHMPALAAALGGRRKVALYGELGAGKTTLVNAFCRYLGVREDTASPTFALINEYGYSGPDGRPALVHHLDLYRLRSLAEALDIGVEDVLDDPWYCFIEWPQLIEPLLPPDVAKIHLEILGKTERRLLIL